MRSASAAVGVADEDRVALGQRGHARRRTAARAASGTATCAAPVPSKRASRAGSARASGGSCPKGPPADSCHYECCTTFIAAAIPSVTIISTASAASSIVTARTRPRPSSGLLEHVVGAVLLARRLADADADAQEVVGVQVRLDRLEPVVAGESAAFLHLEAADLEVEFVVHDHEAARSSMPWRCASGATATPLSFM